MESHSVTCHPTQVNTTRLPQPCRPVLSLPTHQWPFDHESDAEPLHHQENQVSKPVFLSESTRVSATSSWHWMHCFSNLDRSRSILAKCSAFIIKSRSAATHLRKIWLSHTHLCCRHSLFTFKRGRGLHRLEQDDHAYCNQKDIHILFHRTWSILSDKSRSI